MKKIVSFILVLSVFLTLLFSVYPVNAFASENLNDSSCIPIPEDILLAHLSSPPTVPLDNSTEIQLPSSIDNSTSNHFPVIGNQGMAGSCAAWASIYYMYTYEVNRLHHTPAKVMVDNAYQNIDENVYSPTWTHSLLASNYSSGIRRDWAYDFAKYHGQLSVVDCPQYISSSSFRFSPTNQTALINALQTRISHWNTLPVDTLADPIVNVNNSMQLCTVKDFLANGYILGVDVFSASLKNSNYIKVASNGEKCVYRFVKGSNTGHSVTIVGYDDNIWCDINGNGSKDFGESGAFKVANSWGIYNNSSNGFFWVPYDALNISSQVREKEDDPPGQWEENLTDERVPAFTFYATDDKINYFTYILVQDCEVDLACLTTINAASSNAFQAITLTRTDGEETLTATMRFTEFNPYTYSPRQSFMLAFDYADLASPMEDLLENQTWGITSNNAIHAPITACTMFDNLANPIKPFTMGETARTWTCDLDLLAGDMDYDDVISLSDVDYLYDYVSNPTTNQLSNLQYILADVNNDGEVTMRDALLLYQQANATGVMMISDEYTELIIIMEELLVEYNMV